MLPSVIRRLMVFDCTSEEKNTTINNDRRSDGFIHAVWMLWVVEDIPCGYSLKIHNGKLFKTTLPLYQKFINP